MRRLLSPAVAFLMVLLCLPDLSTTLVAQGDNPIMVIRCRNFEVLQDNTKQSNQSKMMADCPDDYIMGADGGCVPDCGSEYTFNPETRMCDYTGIGSPDPSFCPSALEFDLGSVITCETDNPCPLGWFFLNGECYEEVPCFGGAVIATPVYDCNNQVGNLVPVTLTFTSSSAIDPLQEGDYVKIDDIVNCLDDAGNDYFQQALDFIDDDTSADDLTRRVGPANANGEIIIEFFATVGTDISIDAADNLDLLVLPVVCEDPIPTMGQWALLIFAMLLSSLGLIFITKRRLA